MNVARPFRNDSILNANNRIETKTNKITNEKKKMKKEIYTKLHYEYCDENDNEHSFHFSFNVRYNGIAEANANAKANKQQKSGTVYDYFYLKHFPDI